ncbi:MAG: quinone oxidoreductase [Rhodocyclales bacterium GWA2_65_20]|nr:MAG: quinone oxidoreductase [Rhodocyclales bacterium GWA2_65_20]
MIHQEEGKVDGRFVAMDEAQLDAGEVTIKVAYSSVNYKDALAATGAGRIIRRFPCVGGIDIAGTVVDSTDRRFAAGDRVVATSYDIGVAHHGGYAQLARVPADWTLKLPQGLSLRDAMALGTAGFTAGLAVVRMEQNGLKPANGPVIVSGATGGVGSIAIEILSRLGYRVVALTGKEHETEYLKGLGAQEVMLRQALDPAKIKPLDKALWAGAVDNLGGDVLSWLASTMQIGGTLAAVGLAAGMNFNTTVAPFILRGVSLLGIDSVNCPMPLRAEVWRRLAADMRPAHLAALTRVIAFDELPGVFDDFIQARVRGRIVVDIAG